MLKKRESAGPPSGLYSSSGVVSRISSKLGRNGCGKRKNLPETLEEAVDNLVEILVALPLLVHFLDRVDNR
jgi:hypothetical protein